VSPADPPQCARAVQCPIDLTLLVPSEDTWFAAYINGSVRGNKPVSSGLHDIASRKIGGDAPCCVYSTPHETLLPGATVYQKFSPYIIVGVFLVTAWIAFGGLLDQPWSYDDEPHVEKAAAVAQSPGVLLDGNSKEPLRFVSHLYFLVIYALTDATPGAYHFCNILLHLMNCGILIYVAKRWIGLPAAVIAGFLFLINTAGYEAIYSIAASATLLGTAFALLAVDRTAAYLESPSRYGVLSAGGCYLACLLSYESHISVLLPLAVLAIAVRRFDTISKQLIITLIGAIAIVGLIDTFAFQTSDDKIAFNQLGLGFHVLENFGFFFARLILCAFVTPGKWGNPFPYDVAQGDWSIYSWTGWLLFAVCVVLSLRDKRGLGATVWVPRSGCHGLGATVWVPRSGCQRPYSPTCSAPTTCISHAIGISPQQGLLSCMRLQSLQSPPKPDRHSPLPY
jgi:hypothetical protein